MEPWSPIEAPQTLFVTVWNALSYHTQFGGSTVGDSANLSGVPKHIQLASADKKCAASDFVPIKIALSHLRNQGTPRFSSHFFDLCMFRIVSNVYCPNIVCNLCNGTQHDAICRTGMGFNFINRNAYCMILYAFLFGNMLNHWIWSGLSAPSTSTGSCSSAEMDKTW